MTRKYLTAIAAIGLVVVVATVPRVVSSAEAANPPFARKLLYPTHPRDVPPTLKPYVEKLLATDQKAVDPAAAKFDGVYMRILSRQYVLEDGKLKVDGWLGSRPFVFLTVPEVAYGRDLLGALAGIGYDLEDILDIEKGVEKVAVVFAYPETVRPSDVKNGVFPEDWSERVYSTTWDNTFSLIERMAGDKDRFVTIRPEGGGFFPTKLQLRSERELLFLLGFPEEGKKRVKTTDYAALREVGGADWSYRQLIERLIGASEHFRGDGKTKLTLAGRSKPRAGYPEFLGPNSELSKLPMVAIVGLGTLRVEE